jgi:hypothetical protein
MHEITHLIRCPLVIKLKIYRSEHAYTFPLSLSIVVSLMTFRDSYVGSSTTTISRFNTSSFAFSPYKMVDVSAEHAVLSSESDSSTL